MKDRIFWSAYWACFGMLLIWAARDLGVFYFLKYTAAEREGLFSQSSGELWTRSWINLGVVLYYLSPWLLAGLLIRKFPLGARLCMILPLFVASALWPLRSRHVIFDGVGYFSKPVTQLLPLVLVLYFSIRFYLRSNRAKS